MNRKPVPDNHIRRVMDAHFPGLEDDPWFEARVIQRIRAAEKEPARPPRKRPSGLSIALALVLMTAMAVAVSLTHGNEFILQIIAAAAPEGENDQPDMPFSGIYPGDAGARADSSGACGHGNTVTEWRRRYVPVSPTEHQLVDTTYEMCRSCGAVFWVHDSVILKETHDEAESTRRRDGQAYLTCIYCHAQWDVPNEE